MKVFFFMASVAVGFGLGWMACDVFDACDRMAREMEQERGCGGL